MKSNKMYVSLLGTLVWDQVGSMHEPWTDARHITVPPEIHWPSDALIDTHSHDQGNTDVYKALRSLVFS